jgi:hypothetical protein
MTWRNGKNIIFCATGISDSALLRGVRSQGATAVTHSILMRAKSRTVRFIRASHDLRKKPSAFAPPTAKPALTLVLLLILALDRLAFALKWLDTFTCRLLK